MDHINQPLATACTTLGASVAYDITNENGNMLLDIIGKIVVPALMGLLTHYVQRKQAKKNSK